MEKRLSYKRLKEYHSVEFQSKSSCDTINKSSKENGCKAWIKYNTLISNLSHTCNVKNEVDILHSV